MGGQAAEQDGWYYELNGQSQGPISFAQLQNLAQRNVLRADQLVWTQGMPEWAAAAQVPGLFSSTGDPLIPYANAPLQIEYFTPTFQPVYAGFWRRFLALIIDSLALGAVLLGMGFSLEGLAQVSDGVGEIVNSPLLQAGADLAGWVLGWIYYASMESSAWQATLGKAALGIRVTDMDGARITFARASGRYWAKLLSYLILYIGFIMAGFTQRKQGLHDMLASTLVIANDR